MAQGNDGPDVAGASIALFAEAHEALLEQVAGLLGQGADGLLAGTAELIDDLAADFALEEDLMAALDCASRHRHTAQHAALLGHLRALPGGDDGLCRVALAALPDWFQRHLETSDTLLAMALRDVAACAPR